MNPSFQIVPIPYEKFAPLFDLRDRDLQLLGARRLTVNEKPGFPCRVSLVDAEIGETVLLAPFAHHDVPSPYRATGPIFIRENAKTARPGIGEIPSMFRQRLLSIRAYDESGTMLDAEVAQGTDLEQIILRLFGNECVRYLHIHNARPGCFNCRVDRN